MYVSIYVRVFVTCTCSRSGSYRNGHVPNLDVELEQKSLNERTMTIVTALLLW